MQNRQMLFNINLVVKSILNIIIAGKRGIEIRVRIII